MKPVLGQVHARETDFGHCDTPSFLLQPPEAVVTHADPEAKLRPLGRAQC